MDNERPITDDERPRETIEADLGNDDEPGFGWRKLLATSLSFLVLGLLAFNFVAGFEPFFLIPTIVPAVALVFTRSRGRVGGILGLVAILVVAGLMFWIVFSLFLPASLFEFSSALLIVLGLLFSLIAAIGVLAKPRGGSGGARTLAFLLIILFVAGLGFSVYSFSAAESAVAQPGDVEVVTADFEFDPTELEAEEGEVGVLVTNNDNVAHSFTIDELDVDLSIEGGLSRRVTFRAESGEYDFYCVPHPDMKGTLVVE